MAQLSNALTQSIANNDQRFKTFKKNHSGDIAKEPDCLSVLPAIPVPVQPGLVQTQSSHPKLLTQIENDLRNRYETKLKQEIRNL